MKKYCLYLVIVFSMLHQKAYSEESVYDFCGRHYIASYIGCNHTALANIEGLKQAFLLAVNECGATVLESVDHIFPPEGFTMVVLLSESHASIHTYPEHNSCFVDLFTCGTKCHAEKFDAALRRYLEPRSVSHKILVRHQDVEEAM